MPKSRVKAIDSFAAQLAEGDTLAAASAAIGVSRTCGQNYFNAIRDAMGWQARYASEADFHAGKLER